VILGVIIITGCSGVGTQPEADSSPISSPVISSPTPVDTPTPLAPVGVLLTPEGSDPTLVEGLNTIIGGYIREEGLRYQVLSTLSESDFLLEDYRIVVALPPYQDLNQLAENFPETKFLGVGFTDLEPSDNLYLLKPSGGDYDLQGFIAGYIAAMITDDWRVGVLSVQENEDALAAREGFQVGVKFYCGLCNPKYAPTGINYIYPKYIDLPVDATDPQVGANIDFLVDRVVNTFYIVPGVGTQNIYRTLVGYQKNIIGSASDYREEYGEFWVVSLGYDFEAALVDLWPEFIAAETGFQRTPPLLLTDVNTDLLGEGKLLLIDKVLEDVSSGYIETSFE
jgi:hypothetical protein